MQLLEFGSVLLGLIVALGCWLAYQVLRQNGRILQRLDALEGRLEQVSAGAEAIRKLVEEHGIRCPLLLQQQFEVLSAYQATGTPSGYLIDAAGKIASELAVGSPPLLALAGEPGAAGNGGNGHGALGGKRSV